MVLVLVPGLAAQVPARTTAAAPCCGITAIDQRTGIVTARENSTGLVFRFAVKDRGLLGSLKVGGAVYANFVNKRAGMTPGEPCCNILETGPAAGASPDPLEPCCGITAIDLRTGTVTAKVSATGKSFRFQVSDRALLAGLRNGQSVWADFAAKRVSVKPSEPCCSIVSLPPES